MILWGALPTAYLFDISVCRYFGAEAVMWAVGATALVSFALTLFALQSKVRSVTLWAQCAVQPKVKFHKLQLCYAVSGKCPYTELCFLCSHKESVKLSCCPGSLMQCLPFAVTSKGFKSLMDFAVQAKLWLLLRSVYLSIKLIPYVQWWDRVKPLGGPHAGWGSYHKSWIQKWPGAFFFVICEIPTLLFLSVSLHHEVSNKVNTLWD